MSDGLHIKIPGIARTSSEPFNRLLNEHRDALIALRDRYQPRPKNRPIGSKRGRMEPYGLARNAGDTAWECSVSPGQILDTHLSNGKDDCASNAWPTINGTTIDTIPAPRLALPNIASWVYLRIGTNEVGQRDTTAPTIVAQSAEEPAIHHIPESDLGVSQNGDYYILLGVTESDGGTPAKPVWTGEGRQGDLYWPQILRQFKGETSGVAEFTAAADEDSLVVDQTAWDADWEADYDLWELDVDIDTREDADGVWLQGKVKVPVRVAGTEPFICTVTDGSSTSIDITTGDVWGWDNAAPATSVHVAIAAQAVTGLATGSGSVWLKVTGTWTLTMQAELAANNLDVYRFKPTAGVYTSTAPNLAGTLVWEAFPTTPVAQGDEPLAFYFKILDFTGAGSTLAISKRYVFGHIPVQDIKLIPGS